MGGFQNYGPFLGTLNTRCRIRVAGLADKLCGLAADLRLGLVFGFRVQHVGLRV